MVVVQLSVAGAESVSCQLHHTRVDLLEEVVVLFRRGGFEVLLELGEAEFVGRLVLAVVLGVLLDGIVGEVHHLALEVFGRELLGCSA